jgi:hypothetical protein
VPFYWSWCLFFLLLPSFHHFDFDLVPWCPLLVSLPFICYLTNKDLGHRRLHFTGQGTCFFYFVPSSHNLVYLPFISYLTTRTWCIGGSILLVMVLVFFSSSFFSHFSFLIGSLLSSFGFSPFHLLFKKQDLGHRRFHFTGYGACFFFFFPLFTVFIFIRFLGVLFWFLYPTFLI